MDDKHLRALIGERHPVSSPTALRQAEGYLTEQFEALGLVVSTHPFKALGDTYRNVIGTRPFSHPSPEGAAPLIVAAHYDTVRGSPGADDNASALAVLLEAARCLRSVPLSREVRFIAFSLEEEDLLGSLAYVSILGQFSQTSYDKESLARVWEAEMMRRNETVPATRDVLRTSDVVTELHQASLNYSPGPADVVPLEVADIF